MDLEFNIFAAVQIGRGSTIMITENALNYSKCLYLINFFVRPQLAEQSLIDPWIAKTQESGVKIYSIFFDELKIIKSLQSPTTLQIINLSILITYSSCLPTTSSNFVSRHILPQFPILLISPLIWSCWWPTLLLAEAMAVLLHCSSHSTFDNW